MKKQPRRQRRTGDGLHGWSRIDCSESSMRDYDDSKDSDPRAAGDERVAAADHMGSKLTGQAISLPGGLTASRFRSGSVTADFPRRCH